MLGYRFALVLLCCIISIPLLTSCTVTAVSEEGNPGEQAQPSESTRFERKATVEGHQNPVNSVIITPDERQIISVGDRSIKIWDLQDTTREPEVIVGHSKTIESAAISPDGKTLVTGSWDGIIKFWDLRQQQLRKTLTDSETHVFGSLAITPDGKTLVSNGNSRGSVIQLWELSTGALKRSSIYHISNFPAVSLAISLDGKTLASAIGNEVTIWDLHTEELKQTIESHSNGITAVVISMNGDTLVTAGHDGKVKVWNLQTGELQQTFTDDFSIHSVAISPDGKTVFASNWNNTIKIWDIGTGELNYTLRSDFTINSLVMSADGKTLVGGGGNLEPGGIRSGIHIWQKTLHWPWGNKAHAARELPFDTCVYSDTWTRPTLDEQIEFLRKRSRYDNVNDDSLSQVDSWTNDFLMYRQYYGMSGTEDTVRLTGLWSFKGFGEVHNSARGLRDCNSDFVRPDPDLMQVWAFSHQVRKVEWLGNRYRVIVKPTSKGLHIFQFPKPIRETEERRFPVEIVNENGSIIALCKERKMGQYSTILICQ